MNWVLSRQLRGNPGGRVLAAIVYEHNLIAEAVLPHHAIDFLYQRDQRIFFVVCRQEDVDHDLDAPKPMEPASCATAEGNRKEK